jgi:quercetin dioxygenase-like cupin family protein
MKLHPAGSRPSTTGSAASFTGKVRLEVVTAAPQPARVRMATVTFEPGARTAWHTHPHGQTLVILSGLGRCQRRGGEVQEMRPGDTVWFEPDEEHWHGASPGTAMCHLAIQEAGDDGEPTHWLEHVTDADYSGA